MKYIQKFKIGDIVTLKSDLNKEYVITSIAEDWSYNFRHFNGLLYKLEDTFFLNEEVPNLDDRTNKLPEVSFRNIYHSDSHLVLKKEASIKVLEKLRGFLLVEIYQYQQKLNDIDSQIKEIKRVNK